MRYPSRLSVILPFANGSSQTGLSLEKFLPPYHMSSSAHAKVQSLLLDEGFADTIKLAFILF